MILATIYSCPVCRCNIFTRADNSIVAHYNSEGNRCPASETQFKGQPMAELQYLQFSEWANEVLVYCQMTDWKLEIATPDIYPIILWKEKQFRMPNDRLTKTLFLQLVARVYRNRETDWWSTFYRLVEKFIECVPNAPGLDGLQRIP